MSATLPPTPPPSIVLSSGQHCLPLPLLNAIPDLAPCAFSDASGAHEEMEEEEEDDASMSDSESDDGFEEAGSPEPSRHTLSPGSREVTSPGRRHRILPSWMAFRSQGGKWRHAWRSFRKGRGHPATHHHVGAEHHAGPSKRGRAALLNGVLLCLVGTPPAWSPRLVLLSGYVALCATREFW
jgi:hypothetical protein